jgi:formylglycine-generating enzyme required for sulfatase activity
MVVKKIIVFYLLISFVVTTSAFAKQRVAVLDFSNNANLSDFEVEYISNIVRGVVRDELPSSQFVLMTRENILELLPDDRVISECIGECAVETGRNIGADFIITGEVVLFGGELRISISMHELSEGDMLGNVRAGAGSILSLEPIVAEKAKEITILLTPVQEESVFDEALNKVVTNDIGIDMVEISIGDFQMGGKRGGTRDRDYDSQLHFVSLTRPFSISSTEISQSQWLKVMSNNPSEFIGLNLPVENVSWEQCVEFCNLLSMKEGLNPAYIVSGGSVKWSPYARGYRLPTEAEWEYSCRATTNSAYNLGDHYEDLERAGWYNNNSSPGRTFEIATKEPNKWGLYDMHGNVWEWCWDRYEPFTFDSAIDPVGAKKSRGWEAGAGNFRVVRGGCWDSENSFCKSASRGKMKPNIKNSRIGFRVVLDQ